MNKLRWQGVVLLLVLAASAVISITVIRAALAGQEHEFRVVNSRTVE